MMKSINLTLKCCLTKQWRWKNFHSVQFRNSFFSLHIRSMWETICDAWACWSGWNFGPNSTVYPYSVEYPPPPPPSPSLPSPPPPPLPPNENCQRVQVRVQNIPPKWKLSESPSLSTEYPPQMKIVRESKSESFRIPPPNWNLGRSWNFKTF